MLLSSKSFQCFFQLLSSYKTGLVMIVISRSPSKKKWSSKIIMLLPFPLGHLLIKKAIVFSIFLFLLHWIKYCVFYHAVKCFVETATKMDENGSKHISSQISLGTSQVTEVTFSKSGEESRDNVPKVLLRGYRFPHGQIHTKAGKQESSATYVCLHLLGISKLILA